MLSSLCLIDRVSNPFFSLMLPPPPHDLNLICKHQGNCLTIFFSFAADVKMALHPVFRSYFLILDHIIGTHGSLTMFLSMFLVLGA